MAKTPDPVLLSTGELLVPSENGDRMVRVTPDQASFPEWLWDAQQAQKRAISRAIWRFALQWLLLSLVLGSIGWAVIAVAIKNATG